MRKDVIYLDIEDDITAIIGKVKQANAEVVALVPPKRSGALQSAVNLKLLQRGAQAAQKRLVLVTNDNLLIGLAAGLKLPIAKNLQSPPEVPALSSPSTSDNDTIDGADLPVGELQGMATKMPTQPSAAERIAERVDLNEEVAVDDDVESDATPKSAPKPWLKKLGKVSVEVPDFNRFRKRLFIGGAIVVVVGGFLYWALAIAPRAVITISATTSSVAVSQNIILQSSLQASDVTKLQFKPITQQLKDAESVSFTPSGSKNIGDKASGTITIRNCDYPSGFTLPANTQFVGDDKHHFVSTATVSVPQFTGPAHNCSLGGSSSGKATVQVQAADIGPDYNVGAQAYAITGMTGNVDAVGSVMGGGSQQTVTVVTQADVDKAQSQLNDQISQAAQTMKNKLTSQFGNDQVVITESITSSSDTPVSSPDVDQQGAQAKLSINTTYTAVGLIKSDVSALLAASLKPALSSKAGQIVFDDGSKKLQFQAFQQTGDGMYAVTLTTTGYIGPKIDTQQLGQQIRGKVYGEAQQIINQIPGVDKVDIKLSPFWVTSVPSDPAKVSLKFNVTNDK